MNVITSFSISLFVWIAILTNGLIIFRFKPLNYWKEILIISIFTSSISVVLQYYQLIALITFLPPLLAFIFFTVLTGFNWTQSLTMIIVGLLVSGFLELGVTYVGSNYNFNLTLIKLGEDYSMVAWYFVILHLLLSLFLYKSGVGFTSIKKHQKPKPNDKLFIFIFLLSLINSIAGILIAFKGTLILLFITLIGFILLMTYLFLNYTKELKDDF